MLRSESSPEQEMPGQEMIGEVATMRVLIEFPEQEAVTPPYSAATNTIPELQSDVLFELRKESAALEKKMRVEVQQTLGTEFDIEPLIVAPGSVEVLAIITTLSAVLANYNSFLSNLEKAVENTRRLLRAVVYRLPVVRGNNVQFRVRGSYSQGPAMQRAQPGTQDSPHPIQRTSSEPTQRQSGLEISQFLVMYVLLTHTILVAVLLVLLLQD